MPSKARQNDSSPTKTSPSKFGAKREQVDGQWFASRKEARRYVDLKLMQQAGEIRDLRTQVPFALHATSPTGARIRIGEYRADFVYNVGGVEIVEDTKGFRERLYRWKQKHVEAEYGFRILET